MTAKVTVRDVCDFMDRWAPPEWAYSWDKPGLHTGNPQQPVERILACLTVTPAVVKTAVKNNISMIVAHHPLIWDPIKTLRSDIPQNKLYLDLCSANIACFSAHTNLDIAPDGVNAALADQLHLQETRVLFRENHLRQVKLATFVPETHQKSLLHALADVGAGIIGDYTHCSFNISGTGTFLPGKASNPFTGKRGVINEEPEIRVEMVVDKAKLPHVLAALHRTHPYEEPAFDIITLENTNANLGLGLQGMLKDPMKLHDFAQYVRQQLSLPYIIVHGRAKQTVRSVAIIGGSGGGYIKQMPDSVDAYVTGDIGYHDAEDARMKDLSCIDATHYGTEQPVIESIATRLHRAFQTLKIQTYKEKRDTTAFTSSVL